MPIFVLPSFCPLSEFETIHSGHAYKLLAQGAVLIAPIFRIFTFTNDRSKRSQAGHIYIYIYIIYTKIKRYTNKGTRSGRISGTPHFSMAAAGGHGPELNGPNRSK